MANVRTSMLHNKVVTEAKVAPGSFSALVAKVVAPAVPGAVSASMVGIPVVMQFALPDVATGNIDFTNVPYKFCVTSVAYVKVGGAGNVGNSVTMHNGTTGNAITNAMNSITDTATLWATTLNDAFWTVDAGATIRFVTVKAGGNNAAAIVVNGFRVA